MTLEEIMKFLEENKSKQEVISFVQGLVTLDRVKAFVANDKDAKSWLDSENDKYNSKALETWKKNNLDKLIDEEIKKRFPDKDPKDVEIEKVKAELERIKQEASKKELTNKAYVLADELKVPKELIPFVLGEDEAETSNNVSKIAEMFNSHITSQVESRLKDGYKPPKGDEFKDVGIGSQLAKQIADSQKSVIDGQNNYFK